MRIAHSRHHLRDEIFLLLDHNTQPPFPPMILPLEVLEAVIDQARDDTATLHHLSVTCRALLPRVRYHLFSYMLIQTVQQVESFRDFLDSCPWVLPLVQNISLSTFRSIDNAIPNIRLLDVVPAHLLSRLPNLRMWKMGLRGSESGPETVPASLSLHRFTLSCYQRYGSGIRSLEMAHIPFQDISDFIGLVSAFTCLESLTCSRIEYRTARGYGVSPHGGWETNPRVKPLRIQRLNVATSLDIRAIEYLLDSSQATLNHLTLFFDFHRSPRYSEPLETCVSSLSRLTSLVLVLPSTVISCEDQGDLLCDIRSATRIIEHVKRARVQDLRVEFKLDPIASLGSCLSLCPGAIDACKALEEALVTFPRPRILFHNANTMCRRERANFWSATMKRGFARLSECGFITFPDRKSNALGPVGHEATVKCLATSPHGGCVATGSFDGTIIVWNAERSTAMREWFAHRCGVRALAMSPDSRRLVSVGGKDRTPTVWDISNGVHKFSTLDGHTRVVITFAWSPDGALIASVAMDGTVRVWDAHTFEQRDLVNDPGQTIGCGSIQFSPDSRYLAWTPLPPRRWPGFVLWSLLAGEQPKKFPTDPVNALSFDPESRHIATAHGSAAGRNVIRIWDVATGAALAELAGHTQILTDVSFSPDGRFILSASGDGSARIWDADDRKETISLDGGEFAITRACFSPDGRHVATASQGGTVQLWRTVDGSCEATFTEHGAAAALHVAFCLDGACLASADSDGLVYIRHPSNFIRQILMP